MNIPKKENIIKLLEEHFHVALTQVPTKRIFYTGKNMNGKSILICTPESKLHTGGYGWIDLTVKQILMLEEADYSILALRLEGNNVYYLKFNELRPYLTNECMVTNSREGDHWKLHIWSNYIQIIGNVVTLRVSSNQLAQLDNM